MNELQRMMPAFVDELEKLAEQEERKPYPWGRRLKQVGLVGAGTAAGVGSVGLIHGAIRAGEPGVQKWYAKLPPHAKRRLWGGVALGAGAGLTFAEALRRHLRAREDDR